MKDGKETGSLEENRNGEPYALKGARTVRKGPERKGLVTAPRSQATLPSSSASTVSKDPRCKYRSSTSAGVKAPCGHGREELLIDGPIAHHANGRGRRGSWMGRQNHPNNRACRGKGNIWWSPS